MKRVTVKETTADNLVVCLERDVGDCGSVERLGFATVGAEDVVGT